MWFRTTSPSDTRDFAAALARIVRSGDTVVLTGEMGSGKTVFAQGIGAALGVTEPMTSPTFTLVNTYDCGNLTVHHADLYRLDRTVEVADLALSELAEFSGVVLIEWGEAAIDEIVDHLEVHIDVDIDDDAGELREFTLDTVGPSWDRRRDMLSTALEAWS
jgi:tRNA threonylcarbamoyladenosine biosynthesis protein TsaE